MGVTLTKKYQAHSKFGRYHTMIWPPRTTFHWHTLVLMSIIFTTVPLTVCMRHPVFEYTLHLNVFSLNGWVSHLQKNTKHIQNLTVSCNQWPGHRELFFVDTHTFWFSHISCSYSLLLQCWEEQPEERPRFSELVVTTATLLEAVGGYLVLNDTNRKNFASDTHFMYYNWHG